MAREQWTLQQSIQGPGDPGALKEADAMERPQAEPGPHAQEREAPTQPQGRESESPPAAE